MKENMFVLPRQDLPDTQAIQAAVNEAHAKDLRSVLIPKRETPWVLEQPVCLPDSVTVILQGAVIHAKGTAFQNENADTPFALATEQKEISILGTPGACIVSEEDCQIRFANVQKFRISGIRLEKGEGICLLHARKGRVSCLSFEDTLHAITLGEGCRENILRDITSQTLQEAMVIRGGDTTVWGRANDICQMNIVRLEATTQGAPILDLDQGYVPVSSLLFRDITDRTQAEGASLSLGRDTGAGIIDVSVENVATDRTPAKIGATCDSFWLPEGSAVHPQAKRISLQPGEKPEAPIPDGEMSGPWLSANDPTFYGQTDAETLQNAVNAAARQGMGLLIPRYNARCDSLLWDIHKAIELPSGSRIVLLDAHLRLTDGSFTNLFYTRNARNIQICGVGTACLDSGIPNGLKRKNAGKWGLGAIETNALVRLEGVQSFSIRDLHIHQSRFYGIFCNHCARGHIRDLDYYAPPIFPDLGGIWLEGDCHDYLLENLTGITGEDMVRLLGNARSMTIRDINANVSRCSMVAIADKAENIRIRGIVDSSIPEQKKQPRAMVYLEPDSESRSVTVRSVCGRAAATVELGGRAEHLLAENIHSFSNSVFGIRCTPTPEATEYVLVDMPDTLCAWHYAGRTHLENCRINGVFFHCQQASAYMRGTATSIITDKKKFVGTALELTALSTPDLLLENILVDRVGCGMRVAGKATVTVKNLEIADYGREEALCGENCHLTVNGNSVPVTKQIPL